MQKQQLQGAVRSGEEPFSSFGVAKQPLPGLPAVPGHTVQPTLTHCPAPAPGPRKGQRPSLWTLGCLFWAGGEETSCSQDLAGGRFYLSDPPPDPLQTTPWGCFIRGQGQGDGQQEAGGEEYLPKGGGGGVEGVLSAFPPAPPAGPNVAGVGGAVWLTPSIPTG